jgi:hypothetical protein
MFSIDNPLDDKIPSVQNAVPNDIVEFGVDGTVKDSGIPASLVNNKTYMKVHTLAGGQILAVAAPFVPIVMDVVYNNNSNGNTITNNNVTGVITIATGSLPTLWRLFFSANVILPLGSQANFQMYNETLAAFFDTQTIITSGGIPLTLGGNGTIENILSLPANSTFVFSVRGQTPSLVPVTIGQSFQPTFLNIIQIG